MKEARQVLLCFNIIYLLVSAAPGGAVEKQHSRSSPAVRMRAEMGPSAARHSGYLDIRMQDCKAELLSSTVANIGPFLEDEFSADGQPMKLHMRNIAITIKVTYSIRFQLLLNLNLEYL